MALMVVQTVYSAVLYHDTTILRFLKYLRNHSVYNFGGQFLGTILGKFCVNFGYNFGYNFGENFGEIFGKTLGDNLKELNNLWD
jgi:hypothetical protein